MEKIRFQGKIIDITSPISPSTPVFPGDPEPLIEKICTLEKDGFSLSELRFGSHTGTHVDAPSHILPGSPSIDELDLENFMGKALLLDFSSLTGSLDLDTLNNAFKNAGSPENLSVLLLKTKSPSTYENEENKKLQSEKGNLQEKERDIEGEAAYLGEDAAAWIIEKKFKSVGIDSLSIDSLSSETLPVHHILLSNNINIIECLDFGSVIAGTYFFLCLPLKIEECDGAPARALLISNL
jgi:kynurenine formamidase